MNNTRFGGIAARRFIVMLLLTSLAAATAACDAGAPQATAAAADIVVYKTPYCGCCNKWVAQLEADGLDVDTVDVDSTAPVQDELGVPRALRSCHTARVGDRWVEGHVPVDLVRMLAEKPPADVRGLAVPGMPIGSPGMEGPNPERYAIMAVDENGNSAVHTEREGASHAPD